MERDGLGQKLLMRPYDLLRRHSFRHDEFLYDFGRAAPREMDPRGESPVMLEHLWHFMPGIRAAFGDGKPTLTGVREYALFGTSSGPATAWTAFERPRNAKFFYIWAVDGGAGGGAGKTAVTSSAKGGGAGGGGGGSASLWTPAKCLPMYLYLNAGPAVQGGQASGGTGSAGNRSFVSDVPSSSNVGDIILASSHSGPSGGVGGGTSGAAGGGGGGSILVAADCTFTGAGVWSAKAGSQSGAGGNPATPTAGGSVAFGQTFGTGGGGGGAASSGNSVTAGGNITGTSFVTTVNGGAANASGAAGNGTSGNCMGSLLKDGFDANPFLCWGGSGGGANATGSTGGAGGNGGFASGGGGGGAGVTFGLGGNGGPGFIYLCWW
jgi:hypothetical protein